jgi:hypothetical protein
MLTKIQKLERAKRNQNRLNMMGLRQHPGTMPNVNRLPEKPAWVPMSNPFASVGIKDSLSSMAGFLAAMTAKFTPRWMRRPPVEKL